MLRARGHQLSCKSSLCYCHSFVVPFVRSSEIIHITFLGGPTCDHLYCIAEGVKTVVSQVYKISVKRSQKEFSIVFFSSSCLLCLSS
ncbi:hypothetical protein O6P43_009145 [Quillaja saponaria]|uniref:Uncharacterized protein n=1 Tax=Quillaja saponaria TaxID=32244 RepID=A0AAD7PXM4_QUISA|nr:hypothetical protein O6P43_009145 [Quillaja saponaria]